MEVIEPVELRDEVKRETEKMIKIYQTGFDFQTFSENHRVPILFFALKFVIYQSIW